MNTRERRARCAGMRSWRGALGAVALSAILVRSGTAHADGTPSLEGLLESTVVSAASESAETTTNAPATSTTVTAEDLRRYGIRTLDEAINFLSLGMTSTNPLHSVEVGARGVALTSDYGNHLLLLVNGHMMNEQWDGTAYFERGAGIPFELIDHIEVILGPGSVLYGSNAMLGVINVVTKRAKDFDGAHAILESELLTSGRVAAGYGREFHLFGVPAEVTVEASYYEQRGPAFTFGPQGPIDDAVTGARKSFGPRSYGPGIYGGTARESYWSTVPSIFARVIVGDFEINVRAATYSRATPYVNGFNQNIGEFDNPDNYERDRWLSLDVRHKLVLSSVTDLRTRVYADTYDYVQRLFSAAPEDCIPGQSAGCNRNTLGTSTWGGLESQAAFDWLHDASLVTTIGADGRVRHITQSVDITDPTTGRGASFGRGRGTESLLGIYAQQTARPFREIAVNAGLRFDVDERFGNALSPRIATVYRPWKGAAFKAVYAEAFRAPTYYELHFEDPAAETTPTGLKPERVRSAEASLEQKMGSQRVLFGVFRSWWADMVALRALSGTELADAIAAGKLTAATVSATQYSNSGAIDDFGWNASFEGTALERRLRYVVNATAAYARRTTPGQVAQPLTVAPPLFGNARASYALPGQLPVVALAAYLQGRAAADRAFDGGFTPVPYSPTQLAMRATLSGPVPQVPGLSYRVSAHYALAGHSAYVAGPVQAATTSQPSAELAPVDRFRAAVGLQYDFAR